MSEPSTLPAALSAAARSFPDRGVAVFDGRGRLVERRRFADLAPAVELAAGRWASAGVRPGDRVLVALATSWGFFDAWLGAVRLGALPVAVAPAGMGAAEAQIGRVERLVEQLGARRLVVTEGFASDAAAAGASRFAEIALTEAELRGLSPAQVGEPADDPEAIAFLQLTSGSTGVPRAVQVRHRSLLHNARAIDEAVGAAGGGPIRRRADALVGWLPMHHDMGLVGYLSLALVTGLELRLLPPTAFLARPQLWLAELGRGGRTVAHGPNFGYQLCVDRVDPALRRELDLSGWLAAQTGAEMIRPATVAAFCEAFAPCGFRPEALQGCYGLAEATLAVTVDRRGQGLRTRTLPRAAIGDETEIASTGAPIASTEVRIADAAGRPLPAGEIGAVWVRGPGVFAGYWNDPEATAESLQGDWLVTGDLGFLADGELYLTGRAKDLLILRGNNVMPHELEWVAESVVGGGGALRSGAFSIARGGQGEEAVLAVEVEERDPERLATLARSIRLDLAHQLQIQPADLVFVRRGRLPKTTSGKVRRRELRELYLRGELPRLELDRPDKEDAS